MPRSSCCCWAPLIAVSLPLSAVVEEDDEASPVGERRRSTRVLLPEWGAPVGAKQCGQLPIPILKREASAGAIRSTRRPRQRQETARAGRTEDEARLAWRASAALDRVEDVAPQVAVAWEDDAGCRRRRGGGGRSGRRLAGRRGAAAQRGKCRHGRWPVERVHRLSSEAWATRSCDEGRAEEMKHVERARAALEFGTVVELTAMLAQ